MGPQRPKIEFGPLLGLFYGKKKIQEKSAQNWSRYLDFELEIAHFWGYLSVCSIDYTVRIIGDLAKAYYRPIWSKIIKYGISVYYLAILEVGEASPNFLILGMYCCV